MNRRGGVCKGAPITDLDCTGPCADPPHLMNTTASIFASWLQPWAPNSPSRHAGSTSPESTGSATREHLVSVV